MCPSASTTRWHPRTGEIALYLGQTRAKARNVRIIAEARNQRMVVEAIGRQGSPVQFTVLKANLVEPQPDLFLGAG
jgi:hypothetical protein